MVRASLTPGRATGPDRQRSQRARGLCGRHGRASVERRRTCGSAGSPGQPSAAGSRLGWGGPVTGSATGSGCELPGGCVERFMALRGLTAGMAGAACGAAGRHASGGCSIQEHVRQIAWCASMSGDAACALLIPRAPRVFGWKRCSFAATRKRQPRAGCNGPKAMTPAWVHSNEQGRARTRQREIPCACPSLLFAFTVRTDMPWERTRAGQAANRAQCR